LGDIKEPITSLTAHVLPYDCSATSFTGNTGPEGAVSIAGTSDVVFRG
jgi:hypothetical protein